MLKKSLCALFIALGIVFFIEYVTSKPRDNFQRLQEPVSITEPSFILATELANDSDLLSKRIIGVEVEGIAKAYFVDLMVYTPGNDPLGAAVHVVNDSFGEEQITVTYCDLLDCVRVYQPAGGNPPKKIDVIGFNENSMVLSVGGNDFPQKAGHSSLTELEYFDTTLGEWLKEHPNSEIYTGQKSSI